MTDTPTGNPMQSETISGLATALAAAQADMPAVTKNATGQARAAKYVYAPLEDVIATIRPILARHGLSFIQRAIRGPVGAVTVQTVVLHSSGEWISDDGLSLPAGDTAQTHGSAVTYARRYGLLALLGVATQDDDDGAAASTARTANVELSSDAARGDLASRIESLRPAEQTNIDRWLKAKSIVFERMTVEQLQSVAAIVTRAEEAAASAPAGRAVEVGGP